VKRATSLLLIAIWVAAGCESLPRLWDQPKTPPAPATSQAARSKPAVNAAQVSDANAYDAADEVLNELNREALGEAYAPRAK
jgi:hypothetical protein